VTSIGSDAFYDCSGLGEGVVIVDGCVLIVNGTCPASVELPSGTRLIADGAFDFCSGLTSVTIPSSVTSIGVGAFGYCSGLVKILVAAGNKYYTSENGVLFNKSMTEIVAYPGGKSESHYTIPSSVTSIGGGAFCGCEGLTSVTIPSGVTSIGVYAFDGCEGLTSVTIPSGVTSISDAAFSGCSGLKSVTIPSSVTSIGTCGFWGCSGLTSVTIPSSVTSIGTFAFDGCDALKTVYVAKGDTNRVKKLLKARGFDTSKVTFVENRTSDPDPVVSEGFAEKHTFNGLVTDADGVMCGMAQIATAKKTAKGVVKVSGFVMLADGKKQTLKAASGTVTGGQVAVTTKVGKLGELSLTVTDDGFTGTLGGMKVASGAVGEETGILSGTLKMSYFDAKTGKVKTKTIAIGGLTSGGEAVGTATVKGQGAKAFEAAIDE